MSFLGSISLLAHFTAAQIPTDHCRLRVRQYKTFCSNISMAKLQGVIMFDECLILYFLDDMEILLFVMR